MLMNFVNRCEISYLVAKFVFGLLSLFVIIGHNIYRPQRGYSKVMFLHLSVILFTGEGVSGRHPPG